MGRERPYRVGESKTVDVDRFIGVGNYIIVVNSILSEKKAEGIVRSISITSYRTLRRGQIRRRTCLQGLLEKLGRCVDIDDDFDSTTLGKQIQELRVKVEKLVSEGKKSYDYLDRLLEIRDGRRRDYLDKKRVKIAKALVEKEGEQILFENNRLSAEKLAEVIEFLGDSEATMPVIEYNGTHRRQFECFLEEVADESTDDWIQWWLCGGMSQYTTGILGGYVSHCEKKRKGELEKKVEEMQDDDWVTAKDVSLMGGYTSVRADIPWTIGNAITAAENQQNEGMRFVAMQEAVERFINAGVILPTAVADNPYARLDDPEPDYGDYYADLDDVPDGV